MTDERMKFEEMSYADVLAYEAKLQLEGRQPAHEVGKITHAALIDYDDRQDLIRIRSRVRDNRILGQLRKEARIHSPVIGWAPYTHHVICGDEYGCFAHYLVTIEAGA